MRVELLFTADDPSYMAARQNLVEVLTEDAFETPIQMIAVSSLEDAELLAFPGSPTIRIDGQDIDEEAANGVSLGLRRYPADDNAGPGDRSTGVPSKRLIRAAVERARGWGHGRR
jgi:hypothetical protein